MIRINLLPVKRARKREAGQRQLLLMGLGVLAAFGGVAFAHVQATNDLEVVQRENRALQADIERLKAELGDYEKIRGQREELLRQRKTINGLNAGRTGPVYLMRELSEILTPNKGPTYDRLDFEARLRKDPNITINNNWDTRNVWVDSFDENNKNLTLRGTAKSNEDVAEFLKRLQLSVFFKNVNLAGTSAASVSSGVKAVTFSLSTGVIY